MNQKVSEKSHAPLPSVPQFRAARGLVGWSQTDLAQAADVSLPTVKRVELETTAVSDDTKGKLRRALEAAGVEFIAENGVGAGVRLRKPPLDSAEIAEHIDALEAHAEGLDVKGPPSPQRALNTMKRAVAENEAAKLKGKLRRKKVEE